MDRTLRRRLNQIDKWLIDPQTGRDLARILAAVRGPDSGVGSLKTRTTSYVRRAAFPKAFEKGSGWTTVMRGNLSTDLLKFDHFTRHVRGALEALGLIRLNRETMSWEWK